MQRLPDTGQNRSFTDTPGEDSDHPSLPLGFIVQVGTIRDTVTGLMWQQVDGGEMTWAQARVYCDTLTLGGYSDWRLPIGHELFSIHDFSRGNPALPEVFTRTLAEYWWSSDTLVGDGRRIWCTNAGGGIGPHPTTETISDGGTKRFHVRAVRDMVQPSVIPAQFTENTVETINDHLTDRVWMQFCVPGSFTWEDALRTADTVSHAGYVDWRVPNIKELQSLIVRSMKLPTTDMRYFPCVMPTGSYWSSTTVVNKTLTQAWVVQEELGIATYAEKATHQGLLLVRGGDLLVSVDDEEASRNTATPAHHVFPNPTNSRVSLGRVFERIRVISLAGVDVRAVESSGIVDLTGLALGMYVLVCSDMQGITTTFTVWKH